MTTNGKWLEKFIIISKEELLKERELSRELPDYESVSLENFHNDKYKYGYPDFEDSDCSSDYYDDDDNNDDDDDEEKKLKLKYDLRMIRMAPLFASQPRLEKICQDWDNQFLHTCFIKYVFYIEENHSVNEFHEKANDLEYLINLCGTNLTYLDVAEYPTSQIMPIINANCPNLEDLHLNFKDITSQDFENVFSNMSHLKTLSIRWECKDSTLPTTLAKSIKQIGRTLISLDFILDCELDVQLLPDSLAPVFPRLIVLENLYIGKFALSQLLLQSIGEIKSLIDLRINTSLSESHPMFDPRINLFPIGKLKNLERLHVFWNYAIKDEFLINLGNNAQKLRGLYISGKNISDVGLSAINNLGQLEHFEIGLFGNGPNSGTNELITDESIQCLKSQKLRSLDLSNCINITDKGVIKLVENLPNLQTLFVLNTKVTNTAKDKIEKLTENRKETVLVKINISNYFISSVESNNV